MRIGIDARFYGPIGKGLGRYTEKLIENLEKIDQENQYFIFLKKENIDEYQPKNKNFQKVLADYRWYTLAEQIKFPYLIKKYKIELMHFPHFNVPIFYWRKFVVTIHDLILLHFPTIRSSTLSPIVYWFKFLAYKIVISSAIRRSNRVITVSQFTKNDLLEKYKKIPKEKVLVTYEACDEYRLFNPQEKDTILKRYQIKVPYLLYVGNAYPHKNPERLVMAFKEITQILPDLKLVFVGSKDYFYQRLEDLVVTEKIKNIIFAGFVPDYDLDPIFQKAIAYLRPSLYEGFELPPLEAMARGLPVICSRHTCAQEILEDSVHYFNGEDISDIIRAIKDIVEKEDLRKKLIAKGYQQVKKYNWQTMAKKTLKLYKSIKN